MEPEHTYYYCYYTEHSYLSFCIEGETPAIRQRKLLKKILEDYPNYSFLKFEVFDIPSRQAIENQMRQMRTQIKWFKTNTVGWADDDRIGIVCSLDNGRARWYNKLGEEWDGGDDKTLKNLSDMNYYECTEEEAKLFLKR
jgi:hypothetical protein